MTWDPSEPAAATDFLVAVGKQRGNNAAIEVVLGVPRLTNGTSIPELMPLYGTTKMMFYMTSPPTGWTEIEDIGDCLVAVKDGTNYEDGETLDGSWTLPGYALLTTQIPAHIHTYTKAPLTGDRQTSDDGLIVKDEIALTATGSTGGDETHTHGDTWRPAGRTMIMATKD